VGINVSLIRSMPTWMARLLETGLVFGVNVAQTQTGSLVTTFGKGGMATAELGMSVNTLTAIEQSNGDIAGRTASNKSGLSQLGGSWSPPSARAAQVLTR
jgi:hypothetical protein